jgi:hypothetical protein
MTAFFKDGTTKVYGNPYSHGVEQKLKDCLDAIAQNKTPVCTVKTALPHVTLIGDIYKNIPTVSFPEEAKVLIEQEQRIAVPGLEEKLQTAFHRTCMLSEV